METRNVKYCAVSSRDHFKTTQHVQHMPGISTPRMPAESHIAECSDAPLPSIFFHYHLVLRAASSSQISDLRGTSDFFLRRVGKDSAGRFAADVGGLCPQIRVCVFLLEPSAISVVV